MDKYLLWHQLTTKQQANGVCDTLAKRALAKAIREGYHGKTTQFLPNEDVALVINGNKVTNNTSNPLHFHGSKEEGRKHYTTRKKHRWSSKQFDVVDWEHLELAMKSKAGMYKIWQSKQSSAAPGFR
jgi:hypothetical protein